MLALLAWAALSCCAAVVTVGAGQARAATFAISKFTMQLTERTTLQLGSKGYEVINEPYANGFTQAGGHPWALTTDVEVASEEPKTGTIVPVHDPKDMVVNLPPGLLGNPTAVPRCPLTQVTTSAEQCPSGTQVGYYDIELYGGKELLGPVVNVTPEKGQSAEFALENHDKVITPLLKAHLVRTSQGYGVAVASNEIPTLGITHAELTFWGVPADPSHAAMRGLFCSRLSVLRGEPLDCEGGGEPSGVPTRPFLTMPTDCAAGPETAVLRADSWQEPVLYEKGERVAGSYFETTATLPNMTGCGLLQFLPGTEVVTRPDLALADSPTQLTVKLLTPQDERPDALTAPELRETRVTLPEGVSISPGAVDGVVACEAHGPHGIDIPTGLNAKGEPLQPGEIGEGEEVGISGEPQLAPGHCPDASTLGSAVALTPLLDKPVEGHVYLAKPNCGDAAAGQRPCTPQDAVNGNLYRLYLELGGRGGLADAGVQFKVPVTVEANPATGQLTTVVTGIMQAPLDEVKITLNGGARASVDTPAVCGPAVTTATFTPWSAPGNTPDGKSVAGSADVDPSSFFDVEGCSSPTPFRPGFLAGTIDPAAAMFTPFTMSLSREDREQYVKGVQLKTPPGLLGMLSTVPLCQEPMASTGHCDLLSKIGTTRVASGSGSHPFEISGDVYLTGPYRGAPFGLSIVTHAVAGPFDLGLIVVRARIDVNPTDSTLAITTDETGPYAIPQVIFGVPLRLKRVTVNVDRPRFMFNPTSCRAKTIDASVAGTGGGVATASTRFVPRGCRHLAFGPSFAARVSGRTTRARGASLYVKLSYPKKPFGTQANLAKVKVSLPRQLPSRLATLQKACPFATFASNPASCPAPSIVGIVRASTPLLSRVLTGPAYFVSHGGEAFPALILVLEGENVRVDLVGTTFIGKTGITSSTFKALPDVPVNTFELYLPQGKNSALAANGDLCKSRKRLVMPAIFTAQNGLSLRKRVKLGVTGCARGARQARGARGRSRRGGAGR